jgi:Na+-transporting methylmalonyl-CoA/oxaloacetate decarboxylase gamma subunit
MNQNSYILGIIVVLLFIVLIYFIKRCISKNVTHQSEEEVKSKFADFKATQSEEDPFSSAT